MRLRRPHGPVATVIFLVLPPRDAMVFDPGKAAVSQIRIDARQIFFRKFLANILVKFPVSRIARISLPGAPNLLAGFSVPGEDRRAGRV